VLRGRWILRARYARCFVDRVEYRADLCHSYDFTQPLAIPCQSQFGRSYPELDELSDSFGGNRIPKPRIETSAASRDILNHSDQRVFFCRAVYTLYFPSSFLRYFESFIS
jgi:hypothetical protein